MSESFSWKYFEDKKKNNYDENKDNKENSTEP